MTIADKHARHIQFSQYTFIGQFQWSTSLVVDCDVIIVLILNNRISLTRTTLKQAAYELLIFSTLSIYLSFSWKYERERERRQVAKDKKYLSAIYSSLCALFSLFLYFFLVLYLSMCVGKNCLLIDLSSKRANERSVDHRVDLHIFLSISRRMYRKTTTYRKKKKKKGKGH